MSEEIILQFIEDTPIQITAEENVINLVVEQNDVNLSFVEETIDIKIEENPIEITMESGGGGGTGQSEIPPFDEQVIDLADPDAISITYKKDSATVATKTITTSGTTITITKI